LVDRIEEKENVIGEKICSDGDEIKNQRNKRQNKNSFVCAKVKNKRFQTKSGEVMVKNEKNSFLPGRVPQLPGRPSFLHPQMISINMNGFVLFCVFFWFERS
jgi:hypothetical protein